LGWGQPQQQQMPGAAQGAQLGGWGQPQQQMPGVTGPFG